MAKTITKDSLFELIGDNNELQFALIGSKIRGIGDLSNVSTQTLMRCTCSTCSLMSASFIASALVQLCRDHNIPVEVAIANGVSILCLGEVASPPEDTSSPPPGTSTH